MLTAGTSLVDAYGPRHCPLIIAHLEGMYSSLPQYHANVLYPNTHVSDP